MFNFQARIAALQQKLKDENLDALVVATIEGNNKNIYYLSGFGGTAGVLVVSQHDVVLAVDARYTLRANEEAKGCRIVDSQVSDRRVIDFTNYVKPALAALALGKNARVGFESGRVSVAMAHAWQEHIPSTFVETTFSVESLRQKKDAQEIEHMAQANDITSNVFEEGVKLVQEGTTEFQIAQRFDILLREKGALMNSFDTIVASGPNSAIPHHETSHRMLKAGDPVTIDFGGIFPGGYCSDITRTVFVPGKNPDPKLTEIYNVVLDANKVALEKIHIGMMWREYDATARDYITQAGYGEYFTHGLGHSIGLEAHDPYDYASAPFEEGTIMSNEPGIYIPDFGGVRIEDDVVVTPDGGRSLTKASYLS